MSGRPTGVGALTNAAKRHRAYELYLAGHRKTAIAEGLGVTKAAVGNWSKKDSWDQRLVSLTARVAEQATLISQTSLAEILADMQIRLRTRVAELESLCSPVTTPAVRLNAIKTWFSIVKELESLTPKESQAPKLAYINDLATAETTSGHQEMVSEQDGMGESGRSGNGGGSVGGSGVLPAGHHDLPPAGRDGGHELGIASGDESAH